MLELGAETYILAGGGEGLVFHGGSFSDGYIECEGVEKMVRWKMTD